MGVAGAYGEAPRRFLSGWSMPSSCGRARAGAKRRRAFLGWLTRPGAPRLTRPHLLRWLDLQPGSLIPALGSTTGGVAVALPRGLHEFSRQHEGSDREARTQASHARVAFASSPAGGAVADILNEYGVAYQMALRTTAPRLTRGAVLHGSSAASIPGQGSGGYITVFRF
jgi:hypothetical protein